MPIYAYHCSSCGHAQDMLQKISDPVLTTCPACGAEAFTKQVTAAGFQLKGSGWYVTDFRGGNNAAKKDADKPADKASEGGAPEAKGADKTAAPVTPVPAAAAPSPAAPAAPASGD